MRLSDTITSTRRMSGLMCTGRQRPEIGLERFQYDFKSCLFGSLMILVMAEDFLPLLFSIPFEARPIRLYLRQ